MVKNLGETNLYTTSEWSFNYFVKFRPGADPDEFARQWTNVNQEMQREAAEKRAAAGDAADDDDESGIYGVRLSPVSELYFESDSQAPCRQGSVVTTYTLLGIAVLVIVLAFINFVNFFFALVPVRIRTVNTFKVFGAPASSLRFNFVFEAFGLVLIALLAAWPASTRRGISRRSPRRWSSRDPSAEPAAAAGCVRCCWACSSSSPSG